MDGEGDPSSMSEVWNGKAVLSKPLAHYLEDWTKTEEGSICVFTNYDCDRAIDVNDSEELTDEQRINNLRTIFAKKGINLVWRPDE